MEKYLIGLDLGTSAIKGILISADGEVVAKSGTETNNIRYDDKRVEFDADDHYLRTASVIKELADSVTDKHSIAAISMASASGNTLLVDSYSRPLIPAVSWLDQRVTDETDIVMGHPDPACVYETVGWPYIKGFPLSHLSWFKIHRQELLNNASIVCMSTDYINFRLTGKWGIDHSTATTFYLQDQKKRIWNDSFLSKLNIPKHKLPSLHKSGHLLGDITSVAANETGLCPGTKVVLGSFDHPCAARGSKTLLPKQLLISCGTSWVGFFPINKRSDSISRNLLTDVFTIDVEKGCWAGMFSLPSIGEKVDSLVKKYVLEEETSFSEFDKLANASNAGADGLQINPFCDLSYEAIKNYKKEAIARAIMEGTSFLFKNRIDDYLATGQEISSAVMVGGPTKADVWPKITADILGMDISIINGQHAGAFGAAILAGIGAGIYFDISDASKKIRFIEKRISFSKEAHKAYEKTYLKFKKNFVI